MELQFPKQQPATKQSADEFLAASEEQFADRTWDETVQDNSQILNEARQQIEKMLLEMADVPITALGILSDLDHTQITPLSSTTVLEEHDLSALPEPRDWKDEEKTKFCHKFIDFVPGKWCMKDILDRWEGFFKVGQQESNF